MEVEGSAGCPQCKSGLTVAAPASVFTIAYVAELLGVDTATLHEFAYELDPEHGRLWIHDTDDRATLGFTEAGIENLKELLADQKG